MQNDDKVLSFMFDPLFSESFENETQIQFDEKNKNDTLNDEEVQAKKLEIEAIKLANLKEYDKSLLKFEDAIKLSPERASLFNNRAQTLRLLNRIEEAKQDLDCAISLSDSNSKLNKLVARQAYCQRAQIWMYWDKKKKGMSDIERAAELGSCWAKTFLVKTNPYAALCNQMLHQMFEQYEIKK